MHAFGGYSYISRQFMANLSFHSYRNIVEIQAHRARHRSAASRERHFIACVHPPPSLFSWRVSHVKHRLYVKTLKA